jgi:hypothetical protein
MSVQLNEFKRRRAVALGSLGDLPPRLHTETAPFVLFHIVAADAYALARDSTEVVLPDDEVHRLPFIDLNELAHQSLSAAKYFICRSSLNLLTSYLTLLTTELNFLGRETRISELERWRKLAGVFTDVLERCRTGAVFSQEVMDGLVKAELPETLSAIRDIEENHLRLLERYTPPRSGWRQAIRELLGVLLFVAGVVITFIYLSGVKR